jgi:hypothetical protein
LKPAIKNVEHGGLEEWKRGSGEVGKRGITTK